MLVKKRVSITTSCLTFLFIFGRLGGKVGRAFAPSAEGCYF